MTQPLRKYSSPNVPEYASYPAEPVSGATAGRDGEARGMYSFPETATTSYDEQARIVGAALGRLVNRINELSGPARDGMRQQFSHLTDEVDLARSAAERTYHDAARKIGAGAREALCQAQERATFIRRQAVQTVDEYPVHTLAAAGVAGILLGVGLRAWRENRG
jgi:ElaB/YqjD/DUF883 family membrane-anchored ribosome-binding protein